ncbi:hypothetical protein VCSRO184_3583 [Vibrio cholerae]|nr:hypothetical protein VCSRO184_3583 [Vibrio cholerae]
MKRAIADILSQGHIEAAFFFAEMAKKIEEKGSDNKYFERVTYSSFVTSSIISSACALEAYINEWFAMFEHLKPDASSDAKLISDLWGQGIPRTASYPILRKYQIALMLSKSDLFDEYAEPYQSALILIKLRNALVHYEPTFEPPEHADYKGSCKPHSLSKQLKGRYPLNPLVADWAPLWTGKLLSAGCANWAAETAQEFMNHFNRLVVYRTHRTQELNYEKVREFAHSSEWENIL